MLEEIRNTQQTYEDAGTKPRLTGNHARQTVDHTPHAETDIVGLIRSKKGGGVRISSAAKEVKPPQGLMNHGVVWNLDPKFQCWCNTSVSEDAMQC